MPGMNKRVEAPGPYPQSLQIVEKPIPQPPPKGVVVKVCREETITIWGWGVVEVGHFTLSIDIQYEGKIKLYKCISLQYNTIQCNTIQYNIIQCNIIHYNTI